MQFDIVVVGAGPAGLAFAASLAGSGLRLALIEKQPEAALAEPGFDGREIALTHLSMTLLRRLGAWERIPAADISPLREARVLNGISSFALRFDAGSAGDGPLGVLVPNHLIRRSIYQVATALPEVTLLAGQTVASVQTSAQGASVGLADGRSLSARLVVAADTRFSETRRRMGIPATMQDFGKSMLVCRMAHDRPHQGIATEWFGYGQTFAILPLNGDASAGDVSGVVLTLPAREMDQVMALEGAAFDADITRRYRHRLGTMRLVSTRHVYPLVGVFAQRFVATRFALVGDAAVGMHPVTAHGFNLGLRGADSLAREISDAIGRGRDVADRRALARYQADHMRASRPLYLATNATALFYTDDRLPARVLRAAALRLGGRLAPFRRAVVERLTEAGAARDLPS